MPVIGRPPLPLLRPSGKQMLRRLIQPRGQPRVAVSDATVAGLNLINAYRDHGHRIASLDPLGIASPNAAHPDLSLSAYGLTAEQLQEPVALDATDEAPPARDQTNPLKKSSSHRDCAVRSLATSVGGRLRTQHGEADAA